MFDWIEMHLRLESCCKYGVYVDCKCLELVAVETWLNYKKFGIFDNHYVDHKTSNFITILFLTKSNCSTKLRLHTYN